ncbi:MAG: HD domain-containing protein [Chloroflexota bacterium]
MELMYEFSLEYDSESRFGKDPESDWQYLLGELTKTGEKHDIDLIARAYRYCVAKHESAPRKSGIPYYTHPLSVSLILIKEFPLHDSATLAASLLHDVIEDVADVERSDIAELFGEDVAEIVDGVTKITHEGEESHNGMTINSKAATYRKLFLALVKDARVILIKLADRLHNLRTLHYLKPEKQRAIALETLNFYIPLAHRLGLYKVKMELENLSFYYSDRSAYEAIRSALNEKRRDFIDYIRVFSDHIQNSLNANNLPHQLSIVHKHEYEIYKMIQEGKSISDIDNFYSMVIILRSNDAHDCYRAHGALAAAFNTVSYVDYIANPKLDWYQSLNTELYGPDGKRVEILIRTQEMERLAEEGFASQLSTRGGIVQALAYNDADIEEWGAWMEEIIQERGEEASQIIWDSIKVNLFDSELIVYTKAGSPIKLPKGACLIDFAFALGEDTGLHFVAGKVNGVMHEASYKLENADQVEIIKSPKAQPQYEWLKSVVSYKAVVKLYNHFKTMAPPQEEKREKAQAETRIRIRGEDRDGMLHDISEAIGANLIKRINLDTSGAAFEGAISITIRNFNELNEIFARLLNVRGIKLVERVDELQ